MELQTAKLPNVQYVVPRNCKSCTGKKSLQGLFNIERPKSCTGTNNIETKRERERERDRDRDRDRERERQTVERPLLSCLSCAFFRIMQLCVFVALLA